MNRKACPSIETIAPIMRDFPTPFHLYDEKAIRSNMRSLRAAFSWNPRFKEYFAVKANPNPALIKILKEEGAGVDCSSFTELMIAEALGFSGEEIMFSSNVTPAAEFRYARELDARINLDDITHIGFLDENGGIPEFVCLRYNPGGELTIGNHVMGNPGDAKFGMTKEQIHLAVQQLQKMGTRQFGLHAFLASNTTDSSYYPAVAGLLFTLAAEIKQLHGAEVDMINLSGGIGIPYLEDAQSADIAAIGEGVRQKFDEIMAPAGLGNAMIASELGRYMMGPFGCLVATAIHKKDTHKRYIGLDACAVNLMRPAMYGAYHHITVLGKENDPRCCTYDVTGSLCENNDKFAIDRQLPAIDIGDIVVIHDTGAHGHSMGYNYNGKLRSAEVLLCEDGSHRLIRRQESPSDYFATLDFTGIMDDVIKRRYCID